MEIKEIPIKNIHPYELNTKIHTDEQIQTIANSIKEFGWKQPIVIDPAGVVVVGHGRLAAAQRLGLRKVPCVIVTDLSDDEIRAYRIADNKTNESEWDFGALEQELADIGVDMTQFGLEIPEEQAEDSFEDDDGWYGDERQRTNNAYNLHIAHATSMTNDFWQMPVIRKETFIPTDFIGFNEAKTHKNKDVTVHFYVDDYQFERVWNYPEKYTPILREYEAILSPDFSLYMDMPMPMKIWNIYRSRQIGAYYQSQGLIVIPTISWAEPETYDFCYQGIPEGSVVSISTIGVKENKDALAVWRDGTREMLKRIKPSTVLVYGGKLDFDYGKTKVIYYENRVLENWKNRAKKE